LKSDPALAVDSNYFKYRALRKLNFGFGLKLDSSYRFNGFSSGIKYAFINRRDSTTSKLLFKRLIEDSLNIERDTLTIYLKKYADSAFASATDPTSPNHTSDLVSKKEFNKNINRLFDSVIAFNKLDTTFQKAVLKIASTQKLYVLNKLLKKTPQTILFNVNTETFQQLKDRIKNELLWTVGVSDTTYKDQFFLSNLLLISELSKGILEPRPGANNLELNIKGACNFLKDTLRSQKNLKRVIFSFESGVNWVIRNKNNDKSFFELKMSGSYFHNFGSLYKDETRDRIMMNGTIRIRIYEDIWVPLEVKYDPKNGNVFGFLNVKANFTGLGKLLKAGSN
jgi:hypothetical protein